jgi:CBS domain-containing protein
LRSSLELAPLGSVSDLDLLSAAEDVEGRTAGGTAATELLTAATDETLARAAELMRDHGVAHLVVVEPETDRPVRGSTTSWPSGS